MLSGLNSASRPATSGIPANFSAGILVESGRCRDQRLDRGLGAFERLDDAGRGHRDMAQIGRDHVVAIEIVGLQVEPGDIIERPRPAARARDADPLRIAAVAGHRLRRHLEAPGFEQPLEIAGARRSRRIALGRAARPGTRNRDRQRRAPCRPSRRTDRSRRASCRQSFADAPASAHRHRPGSRRCPPPAASPYRAAAIAPSLPSARPAGRASSPSCRLRAARC